MKILLVYPSFDEQSDLVSGESTCYKNYISAIGEAGLDVEYCEIRRPRHSTPAGAIDRYTRVFSLACARREIIRRKFDLVHFLNASLAHAAMGIGVPKIGDSHFSESCYFKHAQHGGFGMRLAERAYYGYSSIIDRPAFRSLDCLVAGSEYHRKHLASQYGLRNTEVIHPGVDIRALERAPRIDLSSRFGCERTVLFAGRLHERSKGASSLIRAMANVDKGAKLLLMGDGPDRRAYEALARDLGISERVVFLGRIGWEDKLSIQKSADVAAIPTRYDTVSMFFSECLACSVPVVAYARPFWKGLCDGAALFVEDSPASLSGGISRALEDEGLRGRLASEGKRRSEEFSMEKCLAAYMKLYSRAYETHARAREN